MNAEETKTVEVTVVLDPRYDMYTVGNEEESDTKFFAAYTEAAKRLERATNDALADEGADVRVSIEVIRGRYTGPEMQQDNQPDWDDEVSLWQRLHHMVQCQLAEPGFTTTEPNPEVVRRLAEWVAEEAQK